MKEVIHRQLIHWELKMGRDGWWGKPKFLLKTKYATTRNYLDEYKYEDHKFDTLKSAYNFMTELLEKNK